MRLGPIPPSFSSHPYFLFSLFLCEPYRWTSCSLLYSLTSTWFAASLPGLTKRCQTAFPGGSRLKSLRGRPSSVQLRAPRSPFSPPTPPFPHPPPQPLPTIPYTRCSHTCGLFKHLPHSQSAPYPIYPDARFEKPAPHGTLLPMGVMLYTPLLTL